jgi:hypothetical protein
MARAMNVDKRIETIQAMVTRLQAYSGKTKLIAQELVNSFDGDRSEDGKRARQISKVAERFSARLQKTAESVKL